MNSVDPNSLPDSSVYYWVQFAPWAVWIVTLVIIAWLAVRWRNDLARWGAISSCFLVIAGFAQFVFSFILNLN